jgi:deaminated glutathione amidase
VGHHGCVARLTVGTCQFPVSADVEANVRWISRQAQAAAERGAMVAHFPEGALSGYAGVDFATFGGFDWDSLRRASEQLLDLARALGIWLVVGSAHRLGKDRKPHNSVYVISERGEIVDRYDKRFCSGDAEGRAGDLAHYSPGDHSCTWQIGEVRCGALICYDYRFPELYRQYKQAGVEVVFHSFHAANASPERVTAIGNAIGADLKGSNRAATFTYPGITMPASMTAAAAANHVWISCANSSARESLWPAYFVRADGITAGRLRRNVPGVLITEVDTDAELYDSTVAWRDRALNGTLHSGALVNDRRSADRTRF